jgi:hypothetical protein
MKKITFFLSLSILVGITGCKKFLEQEPDNRTTITTPEQVTQLLASAYPKASYFPFAEAMSDNAEDKGQNEQGLDPDLARINLQSYMYEDVQATGMDAPEGYWSACYKAIAAANAALDVIANKKGDSALYRAQKGEALVARAYAHFMLVTLFSKAYDPATAATDPGIPYVTAPETVVFGTYERKTVQFVYDMIEKDLMQGINLIQDKNYGEAAKFHFTQKAAHAFASRFYLFKREYQKVVDEANKTIASGAAVAGEMRPWNPTYVNYQPGDIRLAYTHSGESGNILLQETATRWVSGNYAFLRYGLYSDVYDIVLTGPNVTGGTMVVGYRTFGAEPRYYNVPKFFSTNGYSTQTLLTAEEVLFNRAEANLMLKNYDAVLTDLNAWASRNIRNYNALTHNITQKKITDFWAASLDASMLSTILFFKRAFFIHEGLRWLDILRLKIPVVHHTADNRTITLGAEDKRRLLQLPAQAKLSGLDLNPR